MINWLLLMSGVLGLFFICTGVWLVDNYIEGVNKSERRKFIGNVLIISSIPLLLIGLSITFLDWG